MARERPDPHEKLVVWVGSSKRDLLGLPISVVDAIGSAISFAQFGGKHPAAKQWRGLGSGIFEIGLVQSRLQEARKDFEGRYGNRQVQKATS